MTANGPIGEPLDQAQDRPLGIPRGSPSTPADAGLRTGVRSLLSLAVILGAAGIAGFLLAEDPSSDLSKLAVGGWLTALGNVIGFYFGSRASS